jgi:hypothetical protein
VFGGFAIAGWAIAPTAWVGTSTIGKSDRLEPPPAEPASAAAPAPTEPPLGPKPVPTVTFRPAETTFNTALLDPSLTISPTAIVPAMPPPPPARPPRHEARKPFRCPRGTPAAAGPPKAEQIARIETALALSPQQEKLWRPVEQALMEIARHFETPGADEKRGRKLLSVERMQQIYWMAGPLVMSLRDEQKRAARELACTMGLAAVAALI